MGLFVLRGNAVELDHDEIALVPEFKAILDSDKSTGTSIAFKEFAYIYAIADPKSKANTKGYDDNDAHEYAITLANLPLDYKPDKIVIAAIERYKKDSDTVANELRKEILLTMNTSVKIVSRLRKIIEKKLDKVDITDQEVITLTDALSKVISINDSLPKQIKALKESERLIAEEQDTEIKGRGGIEISDSMIPEKSM